MSETITLADLAEEKGVTLLQLRKWWERGLLPKPTTETALRRTYLLPRQEALAAVEKILQAQRQLAEARDLLAGRSLVTAGNP